MKITRHIYLTGLISFLFLAGSQSCRASYGFYVGKNLTADGSVLLAGTGEEPSSHWLEIVPRASHPPGEMTRVGVDERADYPGKLIDIPQVRATAKYITMNYSSYAGFPPPLTNGGMNEHQVAVRDIWSPSRQALRDMTSPVQTGPNYSDLARIVLERASTAREAVTIIGDLIERHGYSTYGGNSHLIADPDEGWVVIEFAGSQGLWVAERLDGDDVRVSYPGYVGELPDDFEENPDYMGSDNLRSFAIEQGWYDPDGGEPFNVDKVYGLGGIMRSKGTKYVSPAELEDELAAMAPVTVAEIMALVRDPRIADDHAGYGQVAHLRADIPYAGLARLWIAPTGALTAPFIPWWIGMTEVPLEFGQHRYLTEGSASSFINPDYQLQEATTFAGRLFKRLMYYTCAYPEAYLDRVQHTLEAFEQALLSDMDDIERMAALAYRDDPSLAEKWLTFYSRMRAKEALALGSDLLAGVEAEIRVRHHTKGAPREADINSGGESVNCLVGADPDRPRSHGDSPGSP